MLWTRIRICIKLKGRIRIRINLQMSLFEHFFKVLGHYFEVWLRIRIRIKVKCRIRIWILIRIKVTSRIQIHNIAVLTQFFYCRLHGRGRVPDLAGGPRGGGQRQLGRHHRHQDQRTRSTCQQQCYRYVTFWCGSGSPDPYL